MPFQRWLQPRRPRPATRTLIDVITSVDQLSESERQKILDAQLALDRFDLSWGALCDVGPGAYRLLRSMMLVGAVLLGPAPSGHSL